MQGSQGTAVARQGPFATRPVAQHDKHEGHGEHEDDDNDSNDGEQRNGEAMVKKRHNSPSANPQMATQMDMDAQFHSETIRVREVFRYLEPWEANIHPTMVAKPREDNDNDDNDPVRLSSTSTSTQSTSSPSTSSPSKSSPSKSSPSTSLPSTSSPSKSSPLTSSTIPANDWTPVGCEDTALAAFAQLGALRLNAQRCIISLVSKDQEIILAESTRTLSLQSDLVHTAEDGLWLGTTSFPREEGMGCIGLRHWKRTTETRGPPPEDDYYYTDGVTRHFHIISDMRRHPALHDRLFVRCAKALRFYASVPIRTPSGSVVGSYAILDDKPRFGVSARDMEFMEDIADTVMGHLEAKRAMVQQQRGDRLVKGLALFNGGKTSLREWWLANYSRQKRGEGQRRRRRSTSEGDLREERADEEFGQTYRVEDLDARGRLKGMANNSSSTSPDRSGVGDDHHTDRPTSDKVKSDKVNSDRVNSDKVNSDKVNSDKVNSDKVNSEQVNGDTPAHPDAAQVASETIAGAQVRPDPRKSDTFDLPKEIEAVFARASNLMRESLNAEGVLFVDTDFPRSDRQRRGRYKKGDARTAARTDAHLSDNETSASSSPPTENEYEPETGSTTPMSASSDPLNNASSSSNNNVAGPCNLLGFSTKIKSSLRGFRPSQKQSNVPRKLMNRLLRRYPHGKIFNYHNGKSLSSSSAGEASGSATEMNPGPPAVSTARIKSKEAQDAHALAEYVSEPRSIAFLPLWDDRRDRWRAGVLVWNVAPNRFLDLEEDVTYLAAFGNSLMSELARLEVVAADQAKSTFISSVSHELRSPLHGVLAGVEFLQESDLDPHQQEMATTISMAGKTLLDTINNILDFTKINAFTDSQRNDRKNRDLTRHMSFKSVDVGEVGVTSSVDLAALTEDVVSTLITANQFRASLAKSSLQSSRRSSNASSLSRSTSAKTDTDKDDPIVVVLQISKLPSWRLHTSPGSWTRIITNLVGNAFKYTKAGTIIVSLQAAKFNHAGKTEIELVVEDTGQGISEDFQKHHLWTPFMQENTHAIGTGLGLSIVKQVVEDVGGQISVESEVGRGTKIRVSLRASLLDNIKMPEELQYETHKDLKVAFMPTSAKSEQTRADKRVRSAVAKTCADWLQCTRVDLEGLPEESTADVCFLVESDYEQWSQAKRLRGDGATQSSIGQGLRRGPPVIVLRSSTGHKAAPQDHGNVLFINQPFGPRKLSRSIRSVLDGKTRSSSLGSSISRFARMQEIKEGKESPSSTSTPSTATSTPPRRQSPITSPTESSVSPRRLGSPSPDPSLGKVLLVEDNSVNMKLLIAVMRKLRRSFTIAENGLEAVQAYAMEPSIYSLILMDMSMPIMDGFTATETIRTLEDKNKWKRCVIIALTGVASAEARERAFNAGITSFMTKPASMQKLKEVIDEMEV